MKYHFASVETNSSTLLLKKVKPPYILASFYYLKKLKENGCKLILWTSRYDWAYKEALDICSEHNIEFDAYNRNLDKIKSSQKIYADFYIDDKSTIEEIDWEKIVNHILKLKYEKEKKYNK